MHYIHLDKLDARLAVNLPEINILVISSSDGSSGKNICMKVGNSLDAYTAQRITSQASMSLQLFRGHLGRLSIT